MKQPITVRWFLDNNSTSLNFFGKKMILFSLFLLPLAGLYLTWMGMMRKDDIENYQKIIKQKEIASSVNPSSTNQKRKYVQKDIWFSQDESSRLHYKIGSQSSLLTLTPINNKFEIIETLSDITCWMQDKLLYTKDDELPIQQSRYFEAKEGIYRHTTQEFIANDVNLSLFRLRGHTLPSQPVEDAAFLSGVANSISFFFGGKTPQFQANEFKAMVVQE